MYISTKIVIFVSVLGATVLSSCPDGWLHHGSSCYHFSHDTEAMPLASTVCQHMEGDLAEIETIEESSYLAAKVKALNSYFWIGLSDIQEENIWLWYGSNTPLTTNSFTNWYPGEPNNVGKDENCVLMHPVTGQWLDAACHRFFQYICEKEDESGAIVG